MVVLLAVVMLLTVAVLPVVMVFLAVAMLLVMVVPLAVVMLLTVAGILVVVMLLAVAVILVMVMLLAVAGILVVVMLLAVAVLPVMVVLLHFLQKLCLQVHRLLQNFQKSLSAQLRNRCRNHGSGGIDLSDQSHCLLNLLLIRHIGSGQDNRSRKLNLIPVKLPKIFQIHFAFFYICHRHSRIAQNPQFLLDTGYRPHHIRQLSYTAGLNDNAIRLIPAQYFSQRGGKIAHQRAADTA